MKRTLSLAAFKAELRKLGFKHDPKADAWVRESDTSIICSEAIEHICDFYNGIVHWFMLDAWRVGNGVCDIMICPFSNRSALTMRDSKTGKKVKSRVYSNAEIRKKI